MTVPPAQPDGSRGLFVRIYLTFVVTVLAATLVGSAATGILVARRSETWVATTLELLESEEEVLVAALDDPDALAPIVSRIEETAGTEVAIYDRKGRRLAGKGPKRADNRGPRRMRRLDRGHPLVRENRDGKKVIWFPLANPVNDRTVGMVQVLPHRAPPIIPILLSVLGVLALLGVGARILAVSLRRRLGALGQGAARIATGDLAHRVELPTAGPRDELDDLALGFNEMAAKLQRLVEGQRILLANVSHELRTPIARVKVQLELLEDRLDRLSQDVPPQSVAHVERLKAGFADMTRDNKEIETLISDLLTSGRLDLGGDGDNLQRTEFTLVPMLESMADRFAATVNSDLSVRVLADSLLLERLLSNLLSNARRACPEGELIVTASRKDDLLVIAVEDEGPGIPEAERERVFEPFRRLDGARSRDAGGVGLGLHLCRQIARAHGGNVEAQSRKDGRPGARLQITLPASLEV